MKLNQIRDVEFCLNNNLLFRFRVQEKLTVSDETSVETKTLLTSLTFTVNYFFDRLFGDDLLFLTNFSIEIFYLFLVYSNYSIIYFK